MRICVHHSSDLQRAHRAFALLAALVTSACATYAEPTPAEVVARDPREVPAPIRRSAAETVEIDLVAREVIAELAPGRKAWVWTFGGAVPGPLLRVMQGDSVVLRLTNDPANREPHSVDLHAAVAPGGGAVATEVHPGETRELRFTADHQGVFLYHCTAEDMPWEHIAYGMYGAIVVEPPGGLEPADVELYVAQSEWYLAIPESGSAEEEEEGGAHAGMEHTPLPSDVAVLDEAAAERSDPTLFTFNGHAEALRSAELFGEAMRVARGGRVRIFFANAGPNLPSSAHIVGGIFDRVALGPFDEPLHDRETVLVPPGSAALLEAEMPVAGDYALVDHALFHAALGARGVLHVDE